MRGGLAIECLEQMLGLSGRLGMPEGGECVEEFGKCEVIDTSWVTGSVLSPFAVVPSC